MSDTICSRCDTIHLELTGSSPPTDLDHLVRETLGPGWRTVPSTEGLLAVGDRPILSVPDAWERAHALARDPSIARALPHFATFASSAGGDCGCGSAPGDRGSLVSCDDPMSPLTERRQWALDEVGAQAAWKVTPPSGGAAYGEGARVGHLDTGYTDHRLLERSRVLASEGRNVCEGIGDAYDRGVPGCCPIPAGCDFKSHGTGTGSVIMAPLQGNDEMAGTAPRAALIPVRVGGSVVVDARKLVDGLEHLRRTGCDVVSMSIGTPKDWAPVDAALRRAIEAGIIPVAAAGQPQLYGYPPGESPYTITVTASTVYRTAWSKANRGVHVDVAAPGVEVWNAQWDFVNRRGYEVRGCGTSFATAMVAGAAASWVAFHGRRRLIEKYRAGGIFYAFGFVLARTVITPTGWNTREDGVGIAHMERLLRAALPSTAEVDAYREERQRRATAARDAALPPAALDSIVGPSPDQVPNHRAEILSLLEDPAERLLVREHASLLAAESDRVGHHAAWLRSRLIPRLSPTVGRALRR